jgi:hypothetical protein
MSLVECLFYNIPIIFYKYFIRNLKKFKKDVVLNIWLKYLFQICQIKFIFSKKKKCYNV